MKYKHKGMICIRRISGQKFEKIRQTICDLQRFAPVRETVRRGGSERLSVSEIAATVGVSYQHAYNVLKRSGTKAAPRSIKAPRASKPTLSVQTLLDAGFRRASEWSFNDAGLLALTKALLKGVGVYAFARDGIVLYVGVATMGLAKRIRFYAKPGVSQRTSLRLNDTIRRELQAAARIEVLVANQTTWSGTACPCMEPRAWSWG